MKLRSFVALFIGALLALHCALAEGSIPAKQADSLIHAPKLLLLDEPMSNMDVSGASEMRRLFRNLSNEGTTLIIATHIAEDVEQLCNVVYRIREGEIIQDGNKMMG